ncbi:MAG: hypothetical protein KatS3mg076_2801 [Candidatus Binatia bacterium]|nr:MAG: hypothetical protein KatS3mg076_2801 [Candidatus Binatia bacterium]
MRIRGIEKTEREKVLDLLQEWFGDREFFRRYFEHDPGFRDDRCLVAEEDGRFVATLQIFPRTIAVGEARLRVGGIGNVFTTESHRMRGVASRLLSRAIELMAEDGCDLSLLFATRLSFYGRLGWRPVRRLLGTLRTPARLPRPATEIEPFRLERHLERVMEIYRRYSGGLPGAAVRDRRYWEGQLRYAGNPDERFLVACRDGEPVAYVRETKLYGIETVTEHGALPGCEDALADLYTVLGAETRDSGILLFHLGADLDLAERLRARGFGVEEVEDMFWMWRVVRPESLAEKLGLPVEEVEAPGFFEKLFPYRGSVFWTSDRF